MNATQLAALTSDQIAALSATQLASVNQEQAQLAANAPGYTAGATRIEIIARNAFPNLAVVSSPDHLALVEYQGILAVHSIGGYPESILSNAAQIGGPLAALNAIAPAIPGLSVLTAENDLEMQFANTPNGQYGAPLFAFDLSVPAGATPDSIWSTLEQDADVNYNSHPQLYWGLGEAQITLPGGASYQTYNSNGFINGLLVQLCHK